MFIFDDLHLVPENNAIYEVICCRVRYMQSALENKRSRIVALSAPLANAKDVSAWLGI